MAKRAQHQAALVKAAAELFRKNGYAATGTNAILERSGAPRGSLYYYFPEGKEAIAAAAMVVAGKTLSITIKKIAASTNSTAEFVTTYAEMLGNWMENSDYQDGNPVTTVALETIPQSEMITLEVQKSHAIWSSLICQMLERDKWPEKRQKATATFILAALDGALVTARVMQSKKPLADVAQELTHMLKQH